MKTEFIDDSPCNHVLLGEPWPRFLICRLSEEDAEVQQVAELVALVNIYVHAWLCSEAAFLVFQVWVYCADELAVAALGPVFALERMGELVGQVGNAAVEQQLDVACQLGELLDHKVLLAHQFFKLRVIDRRQVEVRWIGLVIQGKIDAFGLLLF